MNRHQHRWIWLVLLVAWGATVAPPVSAQMSKPNFTMQSTAGTGNGTPLGIAGWPTVGLQVVMTAPGTVAFEATIDGINWKTLSCLLSIDGALYSSTTVSGIYQCVVAGYAQIRAPVSANAGTITVTALVTTASSSGASRVAGTASASAPSLAEGAAGYLYFDLFGNLRVTLGALLSGEDQTNNLIRTSGGAVRATTVVSGVTTNTTSVGTILIPTGSKTIHGQVVCDSGVCTQTQALYGDTDSDATNGILLCTITLNATPRAQDACPPITVNYNFYYLLTTNTTGTNATGAVYAIY